MGLHRRRQCLAGIQNVHRVCGESEPAFRPNNSSSTCPSNGGASMSKAQSRFLSRCRSINCFDFARRLRPPTSRTSSSITRVMICTPARQISSSIPCVSQLGAESRYFLRSTGQSRGRPHDLAVAGANGNPAIAPLASLFVRNGQHFLTPSHNCLTEQN